MSTLLTREELDRMLLLALLRREDGDDTPPPAGRDAADQHGVKRCRP